MPKLKVLIVDDAVVVRRILTDVLGSDPDLEVHSAANGRIALAKLDQVNPDIVTMDMEMPDMDGLATLKAMRAVRRDLPVIMFSTLTERGAAATLDALAAGANDYLAKPANVGSVALAQSRVRNELIPKIKALCARRLTVANPSRAANKAVAATVPAIASTPPRAGRIDVIAIGISTGGPNALSTMIPMLPAELPVPIVIVQHMPPVFTKLLADRLAGQCRIGVQEGAAGMKLKPGNAYLAPGGSHMVVRATAGGAMAWVNDDPPENSCRPAVDVLFRSVTQVFGARSLGVVMTGMGSDGLRGCELMSKAGAQVVVQDEATSVVWGMPGFVARAGLAERQLPLDQLAAELVARAARGRGSDGLARVA